MAAMEQLVEEGWEPTRLSLSRFSLSLSLSSFSDLTSLAASENRTIILSSVRPLLSLPLPFPLTLSPSPSPPTTTTGLRRRDRRPPFRASPLPNPTPSLRSQRHLPHPRRGVHRRRHGLQYHFCSTRHGRKRRSLGSTPSPHSRGSFLCPSQAYCYWHHVPLARGVGG